MATDYNSDHQSDEDSDDKKIKSTVKKNTFASIITGGRSPEHEKSLETAAAMENAAAASQTIDNKPTEEVALNVKLFKRKRRIEFRKQQPMVRKSVSPSVAAAAPADVDEKVLDDGAAAENAVVSDDASTKPSGLYPNFKKTTEEEVGQTETKTTTTTSIGSEDIVNTNDIETTNNGADGKSVDDASVKTEIQSLKIIIEAKLKFLCDGRPEVTPVQAIMIQLEVSILFLLLKLINT